MSDPQGVVTWWALDEPNAAAGARGWGPSRNDGAYSGGLTFNGRSGLVFNGTSGVVTIADDPSLDTASSWAVWCSIKRGATGAIRTLVSKGGTAYRLQLSATGAPQLVDNGAVILTGAALDANQHAILAYKQGANAALYVDGVSVASTAAASTTVANNALPLRLGADTAAGGAAQAFFNGTLYGAAVMNTTPAVGPMVLPALGPWGGTGAAVPFLPMPGLLTTYRDPADASALTASYDVLFGHGRQTLLGSSGTWGSNDLVAGGTSGTIAIGADNHGVASVPIPALRLGQSTNGQSFDLQTGTAGGGSTSTNVQFNASAQWALARFLQNIALGDAVTGLAIPAPAMATPANHAAAVLVRAATSPSQPDYAPGSGWTSSAAAAQAQLPAIAAYLAVQLQLVRTA
jgi:hypothetical protein